ncbi:MAG: hypothetical protein K5694_07400 [Bacilli bacterium]|nr:hypothetical protein [Bacilli bacterium]
MAILIFIITSLIGEGGLFLFKFLRKKVDFKTKWLLPWIIDWGTSFLLALIIGIIVLAAFDSYHIVNVIYFAVSLEFVLLVFRPSKIAASFKAKEAFKKKNIGRTISSAAFLALIVFELFVFNSNNLKSNPKVYSYSINDSSLVISGEYDVKDNGYLFETGSSFTVENPDRSNVNRIFLETKGNRSDAIKVVITYTNPSGSNGSYSKTINPTIEDSCYLGLVKGAVKYTFTFEEPTMRIITGDYAHQARTILVQGFSFQAPLPFLYSGIRFLGIGFSIAALCHIPLFLENYDKRRAEGKRTTQYALFGIGAFLTVAFVIYAAANKDMYFSDYPLGRDIRLYDIYTQMFDALRKGQLNIDVPAGAAKLWDHAYYNGNAYSYYGVAPIILVSFPVYWLTGLVPNARFLEFFALFSEVAMFLACIDQALRIYAPRRNKNAEYFILVVAFFTCLAFNHASVKGYYISSNPLNPVVEGIYHIPTIYGLLTLFSFIYFTLMALEKEDHRPLLLGVAGFFFVALVASRPNLSLCLLFAAPWYLKMLFQKGRHWKKKIWDFGPLATVIIVGAIFIILYNVKRFDSPFEFGQKYQHTISDQTDLGVKANQIIPALLHFLFNPFAFNSTTFPFIGTTNPTFTNVAKDYSYYLNGFTGIMFIPFFWLGFLMPFSLKKKGDWWMQSSLILMPIAILALCVLTYAYAGLCPRYMLEIYAVTTFFTCVALFAFLENEKTDASKRSIMAPIIVMTGLVSIFIGFNFGFGNFDGFREGDALGIYYLIKEAFLGNNL